jgi:hypothetical protein
MERLLDQATRTLFSQELVCRTVSSVRVARRSHDVDRILVRRDPVFEGDAARRHERVEPGAASSSSPDVVTARS